MEPDYRHPARAYRRDVDYATHIDVPQRVGAPGSISANVEQRPGVPDAEMKSVEPADDANAVRVMDAYLGSDNKDIVAPDTPAYVGPASSGMATGMAKFYTEVKAWIQNCMPRSIYMSTGKDEELAEEFRLKGIMNKVPFRKWPIAALLPIGAQQSDVFRPREGYGMLCSVILMDAVAMALQQGEPTTTLLLPSLWGSGMGAARVKSLKSMKKQGSLQLPLYFDNPQETQTPKHFPKLHMTALQTYMQLYTDLHSRIERNANKRKVPMTRQQQATVVRGLAQFYGMAAQLVPHEQSLRAVDDMLRHAVTYNVVITGLAEVLDLLQFVNARDGSPIAAMKSISTGQLFLARTMQADKFHRGAVLQRLAIMRQRYVRSMADYYAALVNPRFTSVYHGREATLAAFRQSLESVAPDTLPRRLQMKLLARASWDAQTRADLFMSLVNEGIRKVRSGKEDRLPVDMLLDVFGQDSVPVIHLMPLRGKKDDKTFGVSHFLGHWARATDSRLDRVAKNEIQLMDMTVAVLSHVKTAAALDLPVSRGYAAIPEDDVDVTMNVAHETPVHFKSEAELTDEPPAAVKARSLLLETRGWYKDTLAALLEFEEGLAKFRSTHAKPGFMDMPRGPGDVPQQPRIDPGTMAQFFRSCAALPKLQQQWEHITFVCEYLMFAERKLCFTDDMLCHAMTYSLILNGMLQYKPLLDMGALTQKPTLEEWQYTVDRLQLMKQKFLLAMGDFYAVSPNARRLPHEIATSLQSQAQQRPVMVPAPAESGAPPGTMIRMAPKSQDAIGLPLDSLTKVREKRAKWVRRMEEQPAGTGPQMITRRMLEEKLPTLYDGLKRLQNKRRKLEPRAQKIEVEAHKIELPAWAQDKLEERKAEEQRARELAEQREANEKRRFPTWSSRKSGDATVNDDDEGEREMEFRGGVHGYDYGGHAKASDEDALRRMWRLQIDHPNWTRPAAHTRDDPGHDELEIAVASERPKRPEMVAAPKANMQGGIQEKEANSRHGKQEEADDEGHMRRLRIDLPEFSNFAKAMYAEWSQEDQEEQQDHDALHVTVSTALDAMDAERAAIFGDDNDDALNEEVPSPQGPAQVLEAAEEDSSPNDKGREGSQ